MKKKTLNNIHLITIIFVRVRRIYYEYRGSYLYIYHRNITFYYFTHYFRIKVYYLQRIYMSRIKHDLMIYINKIFETHVEKQLTNRKHNRSYKARNFQNYVYNFVTKSIFSIHFF